MPLIFEGDTMADQGAFVWHELLTTDIQAAKTFYGKVVGFGMRDTPMPGGTYTELRAGSVPVGGMMSMPPDAGGMPSFWAPYIEVADVDATAQKLAASGGVVHKPPQDIPH